MPENNKFDTCHPRLFAVTAKGSNSEKAGVIHGSNLIPGINAGAMDISKHRLYGHALFSVYPQRMEPHLIFPSVWLLKYRFQFGRTGWPPCHRKWILLFHSI